MPVSELYAKFRFLLTVQPKNRGLDLTKLSCLTLLPDGSLLCSQPAFTALSFFYFLWFLYTMVRTKVKAAANESHA